MVGVAQVEEPQGRASSIVRVEFGGLCGTDYKVLHGEVPVQFPLVLGHEVDGRIEVAGEDSNLAPGTRVLVDPNLFCGTCGRCRRSLEHLCGHGGLMGRDSRSQPAPDNRPPGSISSPGAKPPRFD